MGGEGRPKISKIVTERYGRAEGAKKIFLHSKLHRARGGVGSAEVGSVTHAFRGGGEGRRQIFGKKSVT